MHAELSNGKLLNTVFTEDVQQGYHDKKVVVIYLTNGTKIIEKFNTESEAEEEVAKLKEVLKSGGGLTQKDTFADFPETGNAGNIYIAKDTGQTYYWDNRTKTYISTGTAGRTGVYATTKNLPTTIGDTIELNKSDLEELVAPTVPFSEGSEIVGANSTHGLITKVVGDKVTIKTIMDNTIDSFRQVATVDDLPAVGEENVLYAIKDLKEFRAWDSTTNTWVLFPQCRLHRDLTVKCEQGNYAVGDLIKEGTKIEEIVINMLLKTNYPKFTNPSATLTATGTRLLECGATQNTTFTVNFNRGTISPAYGTSGYRAGAATGYALNGGTVQTGKTFTEVISESNKGPFQGTVNYAQGEQPLDDEGGNYDSPYPAGSINTNTLTYEFVNALWANTANIATVAKLALVSKGSGTYTFNFPPQSTTNVETFDVPADWNVSDIKMLNTLNNQWESVIWEFDTSSVTHNNAAGTSVNYVRYTDNRGYAAADRKIRISFT